MPRIARDPLFVCLILGLSVFAIDAWLGRAPGDRVEVTAADLARLTAQWRAQTGRAPTEQEIPALIEEHIREEILYREALRLGLDQNDTIVRRRLAQKLQFVSEDVAAGTPPTEAALRAHYEEHRGRYVRQARVTFAHVYWSPDRHDDPHALASSALPELAASEGDAWREFGDPFLLHRTYAERTHSEVAQLFGSDFADTLPELPLDTWQGPIGSAYGVHAVRVEARHPARDRLFDEARTDVQRDLHAQRRREANQAYYAGLRKRYRVEVASDVLGDAPK